MTVSPPLRRRGPRGTSCRRTDICYGLATLSGASSTLSTTISPVIQVLMSMASMLEAQGVNDARHSHPSHSRNPGIRLMSTASLCSNTSATANTADVFARIDSNRDGNLSTDEFGTFLTNLLGSTLSDGALGLPTAVASAAATSVAPTTIQPFQPIPSRFAFAGFAPDNHLGETPR